MIPTDDLLRTGQTHIDQLHREAEQLRSLRSVARPRRLRIRAARALHAVARTLDPSLYGEGRTRPLL